MVKSLDDNVELIDHIGVWLWRAALQWRSRMREEMVARGYPWHGEARGEVLAHVGPSGTSQAELPDRMAMSKQAVQQLVDQLVADGVVARQLDASDKRARRIVLTELGLKDFAERNRIKRAIEAEYRIKLGDKRYGRLEKILRRLVEAGEG